MSAIAANDIVLHQRVIGNRIVNLYTGGCIPTYGIVMDLIGLGPCADSNTALDIGDIAHGGRAYIVIVDIIIIGTLSSKPYANTVPADRITGNCICVAACRDGEPGQGVAKQAR